MRKRNAGYIIKLLRRFQAYVLYGSKPEQTLNPSPAGLFGRRVRRGLLRAGLAVLAITAAAALHYWLGTSLGVTLPYLTFYPATMFVAVVSGFWAGVLATLLSVVYATSLFLDPPGRVALLSTANPLELAVFVTMGLCISTLAGTLHRTRERIPEHKRMEEALRIRNSEARFRLLVETAQEGIWMVNAIGQTEYVNQRMGEMLGYAPQDLLGHSVFEFTFEEDRGTAMSLFQQCMTGSKMQFDFRLRRADGSELWTGVAASRIVGEDGDMLGALALFSDVTERRRAEEALKEADRRKNEFLAMLGHELRNPLSAIRNAAQLMRRLPRDHPKQPWAQEVVDRQTDHLARLVDDLLDVSRIVQSKLNLQKKPIDLAPVIHQAIETIGPLIHNRRHTFHVAVSDEPIRLVGDGMRLAQVVSNLLSNAAKYTPEGGHIWLTAAQENGEAVIAVRDTGEGITATLLPYLFDVFTQADRTLDRAQGGLGLGLTIVKQLVELHDGRIEVHSRGAGQGSEFIVRLPVEDMAPVNVKSWISQGELGM